MVCIKLIGVNLVKSKLSPFLITIGCLFPILGIALFIYLLFQKSFVNAFAIGIFSLLAVIIIAQIDNSIEKRMEMKQRNILLALQPQGQSFNVDSTYISNDLRTKIMIDNTNGHLYIWAPKDFQIKTIADVTYKTEYQLFPYLQTDILAVEYIEDDHIIQQLTRKSSTAKIWLEEHPIFQQVPSNQKNNQTEVNVISIRIFMRDHVKPIHTLYFYNNPSDSLQKSLDDYKEIQMDVQHWLSAFHLMMTKADLQENNIKEPINKFDRNQTYTSSSDKTIMISSKLLPILQQIILQKSAAESIMTHRPETNSTYFEDLLKRNHEIMSRKK